MSSPVRLTVEDFGTLTDEQGHRVSVQKFTWQTAAGLKLCVLNLDAAIIELCAPDRSWSSSANVLLAADSLDEYLQLNPTLACAAHFEQGWPMLTRNGLRQNAAGCRTVDLNRVWHSFVDETRLHLSLMHKSPTTHHRSTFATVTICVEASNVVRIQYQTCCTSGGLYRLAHRLLFNLAGHDAGAAGAFEHVLQLNADSYVDERRNLRAAGENFTDLRIAQHLGLSLYKARNEGLEGADGVRGIYSLNNTAQDGFAVRLIHTGSGRAMEMYCDFPWMHFSTLDHLPAGERTIVPFYPREGMRRVSLVFDLEKFILSIVDGSEEVASDSQEETQSLEPSESEDIKEDRQEVSTYAPGRFVKNDGFLIHPLACPFRAKAQETIGTDARDIQPSPSPPNPCPAQAPVPFIGHVTLKFGICKPLSPEPTEPPSATVH
uniref:Uncharacterized protein n=1 Tax=Anopheles quadriannulatus TaxID=34691 RepID=A0A182WTZ5_ANOQN